MAIDLTKDTPPQLRLFEKSRALGARKQIPILLDLSEGMLSPEAGIRKEALQKLDRLEIIYSTPILAAILTTMLQDTDSTVRAMAIDLAAKLLEGSPKKDKANNASSSSEWNDDRAQAYVIQELARMRTRPIYALIQLYDSEHQINDRIVKLIEFCPNSGKHLTDIACNRKFPLAIRQHALDILGIIGYLDAIPDLERLLSRLLTRINGQKAMPFVSAPGLDETPLIPNLENALSNLKAL